MTAGRAAREVTEELVERFLAGYSDRTRQAYATDLEDFARSRGQSRAEAITELLAGREQGRRLALDFALELPFRPAYAVNSVALRALMHRHCALGAPSRAAPCVSLVPSTCPLRQIRARQRSAIAPHVARRVGARTPPGADWRPCNIGERSAVAAEMALALGAKDVVNFRGGHKAWREAGLPMETGL